MAFTDEEVGLAPSPARPRAFTDEEVGLAPVGPRPPAQFGGAPMMEPQMDAAAPAPTLWDRAKINAREGFDSTLAGEVINYNQSGQNAQSAADDVFRVIVEARQANSPVGLEAYNLTPEERRTRQPASPFAGIPLEHLEGEFNKLSKAAADKSAAYGAKRAADQAESDALPPWSSVPGVFGKAAAGLTALGGQVVGGAASPENFVGGMGGNVVRGVGASVARDAAGKMLQGAPESVYSYAARRAAPGAIEGAVGAGAADPIVQAGKLERGEQEGYEAGQTAASVVLGAAVGSAFRMSGMLWDAFLASRRKTGHPDAVPDSTSPDDVLHQLQADPEFAALARANGVDPFSNDPRNSVLQDRLARRKIEEQFRPEPEAAPPTAAEWGTADRPGPAQQEIARRQAERANIGELDEKVSLGGGAPISDTVQGPQTPRRAVSAGPTEDGSINPAATNVVARQPDQRTIAVDSQGGAFRADEGATQGRAKGDVMQEANVIRLPAPGREHLTDAEIGRQRAASEGGQRPDVETPDKLFGQEERAPQTRDANLEQRQADEAFMLAERQQARAGDAVRDTQVAGRPEGANQQVIHLDEGHPVEILDRRMVPDAKGNMVEVATVRRYDPRTGQPQPDHVEYDVPVRQLKRGHYAQEPRMAQDFEARAGTPEGEQMGLPRQTYRTTAPDDNAAGTARAARPEQPEGPHPGPRWSTYEEAMRDFAQRQQRGQTEPPKGGNTYEKAKSSNQARPKDRDGRFVVDEAGHVMSSAEGPIRFADQKQAAKWIVNVGHKQSPDQVFEIANHPSGKGFTARERGRTEPPPGGAKPDTDQGAQPETPPAKQDTSPSRQLTGARDEAPRSAPAEPPAAATVREEPSFSHKVKAESDRLWADEMQGYKRTKGRNVSAVDQQARETVMRDEAAPYIEQAMNDHGVPEGDLYDIARYYRRDGGETPELAFWRAVDRKVDADERTAIDYDNAGRDVIEHDFLKTDGNNPEVDAIGKAYDTVAEIHSGGKLDPNAHDLPFPTDEPKGGAREETVGRAAAEEGRSEGAKPRTEPGGGIARPGDAGGAPAGRPTSDAGPDGGRQTVIPGAERISDRELAERRGQQPLKGGNEAPPKGGLFDEDARNQTTLFSNPFFDPAAWKGLAKALGVHERYFRETRAKFEHMKEGRESKSGKKTNGLADLARTALYSTDGELRAVGQVYKSPTIKKIADMLFAPADMGKGGAVERTYHEAVEQRTVSNLNKLADILGAFDGDKAALNQIRQLVQNSRAIKRGSPIHDAAAKLRELLDGEFKYLKDAKVDVGQVQDYFPRIVNAERVLRNPSDFTEAAAKQYMKDGLAKTRKDADEMAQAWLASIELGHAGAKKNGTDFVTMGGTPNSDFRKERVFGKSIEMDKSNPLAKYYIQDPVDALTLHFQRTARRAEWSRRFGDDLGEWKKLKQAIVDEGNVAALKQVVDAIAASTGTQRAHQTDAGRTAIGYLRTWGAIKLLPRAAITSLSETAMPAIRSGDASRVLGDIVRTARALAGGMKDQKEMAADLGLISNAIGDSILGRRYFALEPGSKVQQGVINSYFRRTGLEQLTNAQRVVAVAAGQTFLRRLAKDVSVDGRRQASSTAFLRELGISDAKGFSSWLMGVNDGMPALADVQKDAGFSGQYRTAMQRFNQQTSLNPNASTRPKWANHPIGSLAFMLQSYGYAFQKQVLNRAGNGLIEGLTGKGYGLADRATMLAPAMALPLLAAIQWGISEPRDALFGDPSSKPKTPEDKFMQIVSRSGLNGVLDPLVNMFTGARYDRDAATAIAGPVLGGIAQLADQGAKLAMKNSDNTNTAERNFAKAFYDATLLPGISLLATFAPPILGAPMIQAGSSGTAREAFTSAVAGEKKQPNAHGLRPPRPPKPPRPPRH